MKDTYYGLTTNFAEEMKALYHRVLEGHIHAEQYIEIVEELVANQKDDGAWTKLESYYIDGDCRVAYAYDPTYYGCAILIYFDNQYGISQIAGADEALEKGLYFAKGRNLNGHGYQGVADKMRNMKMFEQVGIYDWFKAYPNKAIEFRKMWLREIMVMKESLESGQTIADWMVDYSNEMQDRVSMYDMNQEIKEYVWYACYGSNINYERFMRYIESGRDKTPPQEERKYEFPYNIYFAGNSRTWANGGTVYLNDSEPGLAYGKLYKITKEQYNWVKMKEGTNYSKEIMLGEVDELPIYTFTCEAHLEKTLPSFEYFKTISEGLKRLYTELDEVRLENYLLRAIFTDTEFRILRCIRESAHGISNAEVAGVCELELHIVKIATNTLLCCNAITQDGRSVRAGHLPNDDTAYFYTVDTARSLIDALIRVKDELRELDKYEVDNSLETVVEESCEGLNEGAIRQYYVTKYERNPRNRRAAIQIHGLKCCVCGFDFEETYGEIGRDYIEVHHVKPLYSLDEEVTIDPEYDLVCVCANCHRMLHRRRDKIVTVEELKSCL